MKIKVLPRIDHFQAASLQHAFDSGFFVSSMRRDELMDRITKYNDTLRWCASEKYRALFDTHKGFLCGIPHFMSIPKYTIKRYDKSLERKINWANEEGEILGSEILNDDDDKGIILARGWNAIFKIVEGYGYKIDKRGIE